MRTARSIVVLGSQRPTAQPVMRQVQQSFDGLANGAARVGDIRFAGYTTAAEAGIAEHVPASSRVAVYEADYPDVS